MYTCKNLFCNPVTKQDFRYFVFFRIITKFYFNIGKNRKSSNVEDEYSNDTFSTALNDIFLKAHVIVIV